MCIEYAWRPVVLAARSRTGQERGNTMKSLVRIAVTGAVTFCFAQAVWAQSQLEQRVAELE